MDYKRLSLGLGFFSLALGAAELLASKKIAKALDASGNEGLVKGFGLREIVAGVGLLQSPAHSTRMWNRVIGDVMDLGALGIASAHAPKNKAVWGAIAFVIGAGVIDVLVARGLDAQSGNALPA